MTAIATTATTELDRQIALLLARGYPATMRRGSPRRCASA